MTTWWMRLGAVSGLVAAVLAAVSRLMRLGLPSSSDTLQLLYTYFPAHASGLRISELLQLWAGLFFLLFVWHVWDRLGRGVTPVAAVGLLAGGALVAVIWIQASVTLALVNLSGANDGGIRVAYTLTQSLDAFILAAAGLFIAAGAASVLNTATLPDWLGWSGGVLALILLIAGSIAVFSSPFSRSPAEVLAYLLFALWIAVASVLLGTGAWEAEPVAQTVSS